MTTTPTIEWVPTGTTEPAELDGILLLIGTRKGVYLAQERVRDLTTDITAQPEVVLMQALSGG